MPFQESKAKVLKDLVRAFPCQTRYWDGIKRRGRYDLQRMFRDWRSISELREEASQSYEAYDGGDFIDVGAAAGFYAALLAPKARPGDRFILCEPDCRVYPRLFANLSCVAAAFPGLSISVVSVPVGDGRGCSAILPCGDLDGHYRFGDANDNAKSVIKTTRLDDVVAAFGLRPRFVKIDVEGAEYNVLQGMEKTLRDFQLSVAIEVHPRWLPDGVTADSIDRLLLSAHLSRATELRSMEHPRDLWVPADQMQ